MKPDREKMDSGIGSLSLSTNEKLEMSLTASAALGGVDCNLGCFLGLLG